MSISTILKALRRGPLTNAQLQDEVCDHSGAIARDCSKLIASGRVRRIDNGALKATYALEKDIG